MRVLHLADVHLDRPFSGHSLAQAEDRRRGVRRTFERCLAMAKERGADVITIGGDLWEDEHVTADTRRSVADLLEATEIPVLVVAGNHDPIVPGGAYERTPWPSNVAIFGAGELTSEVVGHLTVWGVSWGGGPLTADFLGAFRAPDDGQAHLLLLHGTAQLSGGFSSSYCRFEPQRVRDAGFDACLAGHIHSASWRDGVVYPGSPEPLGWGETGRHSVALIDIAPDEPPAVELVDVNQARYETLVVDLAGAASGAAVQAAVDGQVNPLMDNRLFLKLVLQGEVEPDCVVDTYELNTRLAERFAGLRVEDGTRAAYDTEALAKESGARGEFVRRIQDRIDSAADDAERQTAEAALVAGLRALDGRTDVLNVG